MAQLYFAFQDIKKNFWYYVRFTIQIICVFILIAISVSMLSSLNSFKTKMNNLNNISQLYIIRDNTDNEIMNKRFSENDINGKLLSFYSYLTNSRDFSFFTYFEESVFLTNNKSSDTETQTSILSVDPKFLEVFYISCDVGRNFNSDDYKSNNEYIPILLGNDFSNQYKVNDILLSKYKVVGILEKNSFFLTPGKTDEVRYLNNFLLAPLIIDESTSFSTLDSILTSGTITTTTNKILAEIENKAKEIGLYDDLTFISFFEQLNNIIENNVLQIFFISFIFFLILFFCTVCMIVSLINFINYHQREFSIHFLCGAKKEDIIIRLILQVVYPLILGNIVTFLIFNMSISFFVVLVFSFVILLTISLFPIIKLNRMNLSDILRSN